MLPLAFLAKKDITFIFPFFKSLKTGVTTLINFFKSTTLFAYMHYNYLLAIQDLNPLDGLKLYPGGHKGTSVLIVFVVKK